MTSSVGSKSVWLFIYSLNVTNSYFNAVLCSSISGRARKNLRSFIPVPSEHIKAEEDKKPEIEDDKKTDCEKCNEAKCDDYVAANSKNENRDKSEDSKKPLPGRKLRKPRKNRKASHKQDQGQCFFPMSMSMLYGPLGDGAVETIPLSFPYNVVFKQVQYQYLLVNIKFWLSYKGSLWNLVFLS